MTEPTRRERFRPVELVGLAMVVGIFTGLVVLLGSREPQLALIFAGITFIVSLIGLAMLALVETSATPPGDGPVLEPKPPKPPTP